MLEKMQRNEEEDGPPITTSSSSKRTRLMREVTEGSLTEDMLEGALNQAVSRLEAESALQALAEDAALGGSKKIKLFLAINTHSLPDNAGSKAPSSAVDIDAQADGDAMLDLLVRRYEKEYVEIVTGGKGGMSMWA